MKYEDLMQKIQELLPASHELIDSYCMEEPVVILKDETGRILGHYVDPKITLRIGYMPEGVKPISELKP